jgi:hypothetical protein
MILARHHRIGLFYFFAFAFPILAILFCWFFFYYLRHYTPGRVLTISETVIHWPENRIFAASMNIEALLLFILCSIRNRIISLWSEHCDSLPKSFMVGQIFCRIYAWVCPIALSLVSIVTLTDSNEVHLTGAAVFLPGSIFYGAISDNCLKLVGRPPSKFSAALPWTALVLAVLYAGLFESVDKRREHWRAVANAGAIFQYLTAFTIFLKFLMFYYDAPPHRLTVVPREAA